MFWYVPLSTALGLSLLFASVLRAQEWTEAQVIEHVMAQSPQARELQARVRLTQAEVGGRTLYPNPIISYSREGAGWTEFFQVEQRLPLTGRLGLLRQAGTAAVRSSEAEAAALLWELRSAVRLAFYRVLAAQARETVRQTSIRELQEIVRILREREREGEGSRFDRLRAERELAEAQSELTFEQSLLAQAHAALVSLLPPGTEIGRVTGAFARAGPMPPPAELIARALVARADYRALQQQWDRSQWEKRAAERLRFPEPALSAGLKRAEVFQGDARGSVVSLSIPLPLFNRGRTEVARWQAEQERTTARRQILEQQIRAQVEGAYRTLAIRRRATEDYRRQLGETGAELRRIARVAYQEGELGILELLDAYRVHRQAELRLLELLLSAQEAQIDLDRVVGEEVRP